MCALLVSGQLDGFYLYVLFKSLFMRGWQPLCSSGQHSWLQIQRSWVRFLALPDFLSNIGFGMGSTQPHEKLLEGSGSGLEHRD
jgi:hypothetical protein